MSTTAQPKSTLRLLAPNTWGIVLLGILLCMWVEEWWGLFDRAPHDHFNLRLSITLIVGYLLLETAIAAVCLARGWSRRYGISWALLLMLAAAIPASMYGKQANYRSRQQEALGRLKAAEVRVLTGKRHRQFCDNRKVALEHTFQNGKNVLTVVNFAVEEDIGCGCCYDVITTDVADQELAAMAFFPHIEQLDLSRSQITDTGLRHLRWLKHLKTLNLSGSKITDQGLRHLGRLENLQELNLAHTATTDNALSILQRMTKLTTLDLSNTQVTDRGISAVASLPNLKSLNVRDTNVKGSCFAQLAACSQLESLSHGETSVAWLNSLNGIPRLQGIFANVTLPSRHEKVALSKLAELNYFGVVTSLPVAEIRLSDLPKLSSADFSLSWCTHQPEVNYPSPLRCSQCPQRFEQVVLHNLPQLRSLSLTHVEVFELDNVPNLENISINGVTSRALFTHVAQAKKLKRLTVYVDQYEDASAFEALGTLPKLETLRLTGTGLNDRTLAALRGFPALKSLVIPSGEFTGEGLANLAHTPQLERLEIGNVTDPGEPLAVLNKLEFLKEICIESGRIGTFHLQGLALRQLSIGADCDSIRLHDIDELSAYNIDADQNVRALELVNLPQMVYLRLNGNREQPLESLRLEDLPRLEDLSVTSAHPNPHLTDASFENLATFTAIDVLCLDNTRITPATLKHLYGSTKLTRATFYNTPVGQKAVDELAAHLEKKNMNVRLYWGVSPSSGLDENGNFPAPANQDAAAASHH